METTIIAWVVKQVREHKWSLDACCGCAKRHCLFSENEMACTHTLYNMVWAGLLPIGDGAAGSHCLRSLNGCASPGHGWSRRRCP